MLARSEPLRKPFSGSSTSENNPSRDCLKIRERLQTGTCEAAKGAKKKALVRPIATSGTHHRVYFNPFSDSLSRNRLIIPERPRRGPPRGLRTGPGAPFGRIRSHRMQGLEAALTIYQTVSPRTRVNKGEKMGRSCYYAPTHQLRPLSMIAS